MYNYEYFATWLSALYFLRNVGIWTVVQPFSYSQNEATMTFEMYYVLTLFFFHSQKYFISFEIFMPVNNRVHNLHNEFFLNKFDVNLTKFSHQL